MGAPIVVAGDAIAGKMCEVAALYDVHLLARVLESLDYVYRDTDVAADGAASVDCTYVADG